jgi:hypothetical protein
MALLCPSLLIGWLPKAWRSKATGHRKPEGKLRAKKPNGRKYSEGTLNKELRKKTFNADFFKAGRCDKGDKCFFSHTISPATSRPRSDRFDRPRAHSSGEARTEDWHSPPNKRRVIISSERI